MQWGMPTLVELANLKENLLLCKELGFDFIEINMNLPSFQPDKLARLEALIAPPQEESEG